jgi:hypothetical protein
VQTVPDVGTNVAFKFRDEFIPRALCVMFAGGRI